MRRIPRDENWLSRHLSLKDNELLVCRGIAAEYLTGICEDDAEWWTQARLRREWDYLKVRSEKQRARANKRWVLKNKENDECRGNAEPHLSGNAPTPTPTPTPLEEDSPSFHSGESAQKNLNGVNGHAKRERATRLPVDWQPSPELLEFATSLKLNGLAVAEQFRDYWIAISGSKGLKLNWDATYRNWCRREAERPSGKVQRNGPATGIANGFAEALRQRRERDEDSGGDFPPTRPLLGRQ